MRVNPKDKKLCEDYIVQRRKLIAAFFVGFSTTALLTNFASVWLVALYGVCCLIGVISYSAFLGFGVETERSYFGRYRKDGGEDLRYSKHVSYNDHHTFQGLRISEIKVLLKHLKKREE
ncbi:hypothetical protein AB4188_01665 [Vibrio lentus]